VRRREAEVPEQMTALQQLTQTIAVKQALRERIMRAHDAGDLAEVDRLWVEVEELGG